MNTFDTNDNPPPAPTLGAAPAATLSADGPAPEPTRQAKLTSKELEAAFPSVLGSIDVLTEAEQSELLACEAVIQMGWNNFIEVGLALSRIREARLYRAAFESFEFYCRARWEYGRRQVDRLISASQVVRQLRPKWSHCLPDNEAQIRPLSSLTPDQAALVWEHTVQKAGGRRISARLVKSAVQELHLDRNIPPPTERCRPAKAELRRLIDTALGELLVLAGQRASQNAVVEKVEVLHGHISALFAELDRKSSSSAAVSSLG